ncbi:Quinoprotein glucose dehydrogenase B precursor [Pirellulimonas nuda]|uniref:Quinoprotein glucose dehydrogenase B n=1 Tax=Pirellulimonas nuda TaxID=2528009 RepID=A0A518DCP2_9BACT|nr:malectin domain-containing carbohydrate-binding protein [Pirellulimonas nuda]QDU89230.1 Quinoprotein glucose dehydrogenase B precursor [Pirellulimonas nuda]
MPRRKRPQTSRPFTLFDCGASPRQAARSLRFESLEGRELLTTLLVNFNRDVAGLNPVTAADFAVADAAVDLAATVNSVQAGGATGLLGSGGAIFDIVDSANGNDFTTNKGVYVDEPILDSYIYINNVSRTITVTSLEEIAAGQTVTVTLFGVGDAANQESLFTLNYNGATVGTGETDYGASFYDAFVSLSFTKVVGVDEFSVVFQNAGNGSSYGAFNGFSVTTPSAVRINAGGSAHVDSEGHYFQADQYYSASQTFSVTDDIFIPGTGGTTANDEDVDDILYQTERNGADLNYEIPVANGFYTLRLHYAEIYHDDIGQRIFDVSAEGDLISDNLDIFEARQNAFTPGNFAALIQEFPLIEVTDGAMSLRFEALAPDGVDRGKISAIEIIPVESPQLALLPTGGNTTVLENGFTDTYGLSLTVAPTADVTVTISTGSQVTADLTQLVFTPENYDQPQIVTLTAVNDSDLDGTQTVQVTHALTSLDPLYNGILAPSLPVIVLDDDLVEVDFNMRNLTTGITNPTTGTFGPDGRLYVANQNGQIQAYTLDGANNVTATQTINTVANLSGFNTILGIAFNPFELVPPGASPTIYVTRSSLYDGTEEYGSRVSTLTGPNFSTVTDIVTGLPVSGFDHGVNGIQFDNNGDLLIAVGGNTNTGVFDGIYGSQAPESPLTSAILRARITDPAFNGAIQYEFIDPNDPELLALAASENDPNPDPNDQRYGNFVKVLDVPGETEVETFAVGFRNPFDLVWTTEGRIFATDNGPNGIAKDELNLIAEGGFYGHPSIPRGKLDPRQTLENAEYDVDVPSNADYTAPLAELASSTDGIDEYRAETFGGQLRGQLFAQKYNGLVYFFELTPDGADLANVNTRTDVGDGLDIIAGPGGTLISMDRNQSRVTIAEPYDPTVVTPKAYDMFPFRAPAVGGNQFVIGGVNFGSLANTTVLIGGREATLTSVEGGKISGILPAVPGVTLQDVVVISNGTASFLNDAFLPLNGVAPLEGDYDFNGTVEQADYQVWKGSFGSTTHLAADGNGDGVVDAGDYSVWRDNLGAMQPAPALAPAPAAAAEAGVVESLAAAADAGPSAAAAFAFAIGGADEVSERVAVGKAVLAEPVFAATNDDQLLLLATIRAAVTPADSPGQDASPGAEEASSKDEVFASYLLDAGQSFGLRAS